MPNKSFKITITGQVQGVGFRPYVYGLAQQFHLYGNVSNNEMGVIINLNGNENEIYSFYNALIKSPPKVSKIKTHHLTRVPNKEFEDFKIIHSKKSGKLNLQLTPDFAICNDCKTEISDPNNRRFHYGFTTCVNCGPRWAITNTFPFERVHTNMEEFDMCETCKKEYSDPLNRRFHSQTNSCPECGIEMTLTDNMGAPINIEKDKLFKKVASFIKNGKIVAIKNTGGYLFCCDASNKKVVNMLRQKKNRPKKPFALLYPSIENLKKEIQTNDVQEHLLQSSESPIVIIPKKNYQGNLALNEIAPGLNQLGIMLPYSAILYLLAKELNIPIVATSGNIHGSPIISSNGIAHEALHEVADYFVHHNLKITNPQDDSVIKFSPKFNQKVIFRRARGLAPNYFGSFSSQEKILALGSHLKSTIAFLPNDFLYISQYLGNMDHFEVYTRFVETTSKFMSLFEQEPSVILADAHPGYQSILYGKDLAKNLKAKYIQIQHHKAHFASVLGEHDLFDHDNILGVVWDGVGYGDDAQVWGGEFFKYESRKINRVGHFEYFDWLAADKMSKEPRISLLSLADSGLKDIVANKFSNEELKIYQKLKSQNRLKTSSVGRLFDAVASLLNICQINTYEGEAAILIENVISTYDLKQCKAYCEISEEGSIPTRTIIKNINLDLKKGVSKEDIILNFLFTLASVIFQIAQKENTKNIALSGGVFQNTVLIDMLKEMAKTDFNLFFNHNLSPNDENISFGQIMYYLHVNE